MGTNPELPYGQLPPRWRNSTQIRRERAERWFTEAGPGARLQAWMDEVHEANPGDLIPLQWASTYIGLSRTAVQKRAEAGMLTVFSFVITQPTRTLMGKSLYRDSRRSFDYVLRSECDAWRGEIIARLPSEEPEPKSRSRGLRRRNR